MPVGPFGEHKGEVQGFSLRGLGGGVGEGWYVEGQGY